MIYNIQYNYDEIYYHLLIVVCINYGYQDLYVYCFGCCIYNLWLKRKVSME